MSSLRYDDIVSRLLQKLPEFKVEYEELVEMFGEDVGPHVVFGALFHFVLEHCRALSAEPTPFSASHDTLHRAFNFIEEAASSEDEDVENLVQVSFMEHMWQAGSEYETIVARFGPASLKLLKGAESW